MTDAKGTRTLLFPEPVKDGQLIGRSKLVDGTYGELRKTPDGQYTLEFDRNGHKKTITAGGAAGDAVGDQVDSMWVGLSGSGTVRSWVNTSTGFDDGVIQSKQGCVSTRLSDTPFKGVKVRLTNGDSGPKADLINASDASMTPFETLSAKNTTGLFQGARIQVADHGKATFQMRVSGAPALWQSVAVPAVPTGDGCESATKTAAKSTAKTTSTAAVAAKGTADVTAQTVAQTTVVPKGAVAAGAEVPQQDGRRGPLIAAGAALVAGAAAFVGLRRRAAARR
ncbi:hypothetical protein ACFYM2_28085 [Streptomyces sp. NPDC006711]|uniref:hypothetical protein n=1 Tax=Streptomyces sp. NPDC006711 TaxID=3364762 RepID=UPI0036C03035